MPAELDTLSTPQTLRTEADSELRAEADGVVAVGLLERELLAIGELRVEADGVVAVGLKKLDSNLRTEADRKLRTRGRTREVPADNIIERVEEMDERDVERGDDVSLGEVHRDAAREHAPGATPVSITTMPGAAMKTPFAKKRK